MGDFFTTKETAKDRQRLLQRTATRFARRPGMDAVLCAAVKDVREIISASGLAGVIIRTSLLCPTEPMPFGSSYLSPLLGWSLGHRALW